MESNTADFQDTDVADALTMGRRELDILYSYYDLPIIEEHHTYAYMAISRCVGG